MDKEQLLQYRILKLEIEDLEDKLQNVKTKLVMDKVQASAIEYPYNLYSLKICGLEEDAYTQRLQLLLRRRIRKCKRARIEIEEYIDGIEDSRMRYIFTKRYIDEWTWIKISMRLGSTNEAYARILHDRFFKNL
ncbi:MAG: hypothetical protein E6Z55_06105 [Peptoniphilus harei]|nr:hypothetical protein [Peptoniphilus harei]